MKKFFLLSAVSLLLLPRASFAQKAETCKLQTYASSWMATGTPFSVKCPSGVYTGVLIATPARNWFRRGHLMLKFNQPVTMAASKPGQEAKIQPGRGQAIVSMLVDGGAGIGAKDITDGLSGAVFKSWYMIPISFATLAIFSHGGNVNLKPGYKLRLVHLNLPTGSSLITPDEKPSTHE